MKKLTVKKVTSKKPLGKQTKISSFFSQGKNDSVTKCDTSQTKISSYFQKGKNEFSASDNSKQIKDFTGCSKRSKLDTSVEIDLTEDDDDNIKSMYFSSLKSTSNFQNDINSEIQNSRDDLQTGSLEKKKSPVIIKIHNKENSPVKSEKMNVICEDSIIKVDSCESPEVVLPTPPKELCNRRHKKGVKRKFTFSNSCGSSLLISCAEKSTNEVVNKEVICSDSKSNSPLNSVKQESKVNINFREPSIISCESIKRFNTVLNKRTVTNKPLSIKIKESNDVNLENVCALKATREQPLSLTSNAEPVTADNSDANCIKEDLMHDITNNFGFVEDCYFDDWDELNKLHQLEAVVSLDKSTRCKVLSISYKNELRETHVLLKDCTTSVEVKCILLGSWSRIALVDGDLVSVMAKFDENRGWLVTDTAGHVVFEPDVLVAGTTLVGSLFCMRRAILTDMFRGLDPSSEVMVIGSLLHEILQEVLKLGVRSIQEVKNVVNKLINTDEFIFTLYSGNISMVNVRLQLNIFIPQIVKFLCSYIRPVTKKSSFKHSWKGEVTAVEDIEESIWATNLGLKGKIDVTVAVKCRDGVKKMPLELKTGRASFSAEHRGQVILYALMMTELGKDVNSGLLLYLREGVMREVKAGIMEKRDLLLLRNELVRFTKDRENSLSVVDGVIKYPKLPEPISNLRGCTACPYLTICSAVLKESGTEQLSPSNPLNELLLTATKHLKSEHIQFVFHWVGLLQLEEKEIRRGRFSVKDVWNFKPEEREKRGSGVSFVKLDKKADVEIKGNQYLHTFIRDCDFPSYIIAAGEYLVVSTDSRVAIAAGVVNSVTKNSCTINLDRNLSGHKESSFHLDKYESQNQFVFNMTNLGHLLEATPESEFLREKIISLELPVYSRLSSEILKVGQDVLTRLNKEQKHAVLQALASQHFLLIKGMPGTGKTATLVALIELLVMLGQSVLVTSHTHSAVDNVLRKLSTNVSILRLGALSKVHADVKAHSEHHIKASSPEELGYLFNSKQVVGVTCLGSGHPLLRRRKFDLVIVDEATQVLLPTLIRPLIAALKFVLVGDPMQLPPLVRSKQASELGLRKSLFSHLDRPAVTAELRIQYRMNQCITDLANGLSYDGKLACANETVSQASIVIGNRQDSCPDWMCLPLSTKMEHSVVVLDTGSVSEAKTSNQYEAECIHQMVKVFLEAGTNASCLGVIAPYQSQVTLIRNIFKSDSVSVDVNSVDTFQGRDKEIILYSCTRSCLANETSILSDHSRLTVAITRAKQKLLVFGDVQTLKSYSVLNKLFSLIDSSCFVKLPLCR